MAEDNNILTYALIGVGAYLVYNYIQAQSQAAALPPPLNTPSTPITQTPVNQPSNTSAGGAGQSSPSAKVTMPVPTASSLEQAAAGAGYTPPYIFNLYQWNYFYTAVTGQSTAPLQVYSGDPNVLLTSSQYVSLLPSYFSQNGMGRVGVVHASALRRGAGVYGWS